MPIVVYDHLVAARNFRTVHTRELGRDSQIEMLSGGEHHSWQLFIYLCVLPLYRPRGFPVQLVERKIYLKTMRETFLCAKENL